MQGINTSVVIIGSDQDALLKYLEENGIPTSICLPSQVPSLTALLLSSPAVIDIIIAAGEEKNWSMGHILAAAKQLQYKGHLVFMDWKEHLPPLISNASDNNALLKLLKRSARPASSSSGGLGASTKPEGAAVHAEVKHFSLPPLNIPPDKVLMLGVIGSQHRIGCTTQAVGLWHYCKALGFDPAVVASPAQIAEIAGPMHSEKLPSGYLIEGIPFVTDTAQLYDCYILDIGPGKVQEALQAADHLVLVAGSKPWELQHTAAALRAVRKENISILLSFSSRSDAKTLQPLFGSRTAFALPWMPELWKPTMEALAIYDTVLRPTLEKLLSRQELEILAVQAPTEEYHFAKEN